MLANAYVWGDSAGSGTAREVLPAVLATPLCAVSARLRRPPIVTYASYVLNNWRTLDDNAELGTIGHVARLVPRNPM